MADLVFNIAKGSVAQHYQNIDGNNPAASAFILVPIDAGATTDATFRDHDTLSAVLGASTERTTNGWNRKTLTDADLVAFAPDDTNDRVDLDFPDQTWTAVGAGGGATTDVVLGYDTDTAAGTDANIVPDTLHDFIITPDGSDVTLTTPNGFYRAS
jgi:hypothetical protein